MRCLARLMRWAIVASGTRNALAISRGGQAADRAQRQRDLRRPATAPDGSTGTAASACRRASARRSSSGAGATSSSAGTAAAAASSRRRRASSLRSSSVSRRDGDRDQPAARVVGHALARPLHARPPAAPPARRPRTRRSGRSGGRARRGPAAPARAAGPRRAASRRSHLRRRPSSMSGRTSTGAKRAIGQRRGDLERPLEALAVDDDVAGELLLGLGERPVGDRRRAVDAGGPSWRSTGRPAPRRRPARPTR